LEKRNSSKGESKKDSALREGGRQCSLLKQKGQKGQRTLGGRLQREGSANLYKKDDLKNKGSKPTTRRGEVG